jgi:membrane protein DedA with SNARE-associated domain
MLQHAVLAWISRYGYAALAGLLAFGVIGLPVPDETLLCFAGYLAWRGDLHLSFVMVTALGGATSGITASYFIGRTLGRQTVERLGGKVGVTPAKLERTRSWFTRWGKWTFVIGYFIPGFRHANAVVAGTSDLRYRGFAPFAYAGALLWSQTFVLLGYSFGKQWQRVVDFVESHTTVVWIAGGAVATLLLLVHLLRRR